MAVSKMKGMPIAELIAIVDAIKKWTAGEDGRACEWAVGVDMLWNTLVSGRHGLLIGPPGIAKSQVIEDTTAGIEGCRLFGIQMHPRMKETALTGEVDIQQFGATGEVRYNIAGYLTDADIGHLEEIFLGNAGALFTLMKMMTRGQIRLGAQLIDAAPIIIGDSNAMPDVLNAGEDDVDKKTLGAFRDRFLCGMVLHQFVRGSKSRMKMMNSKVDKRRQGEKPPVQLPMAGLLALREKCWDMAENIPKPTAIRMLKLVDGLRKSGIMLYERRWIWAREAMAANALLHGRDVVSDIDLKTARWWGWAVPDQIPVVYEVLRQFVPSAMPKVLAEEVACDKIFADLMATKFGADTRGKHAKGTEASAKMSDTQRALSDMIRAHPDEIDEITPVIDKLKAYNRQINSDILGIDLGDD